MAAANRATLASAETRHQVQKAPMTNASMPVSTAEKATPKADTPSSAVAGCTPSSRAGSSVRTAIQVATR